MKLVGLGTKEAFTLGYDRECPAPARVCGHCGGSKHSAGSCWYNPASPVFRPKLAPKRGAVNAVESEEVGAGAEADL